MKICKELEQREKKETKAVGEETIKIEEGGTGRRGSM